MACSEAPCHRRGKPSIVLGRVHPVSANNLGDLVRLVGSEEISGKMAKTVFEEMFTTGRSPKEIVAEKGLKQIVDPVEIARIVNTILDANQGQLTEYLNGNERLLGFFVGQIMKATAGNANPKKVNEVLIEALNKRRSKP